MLMVMINSFLVLVVASCEGRVDKLDNTCYNLYLAVRDG